MTSTIDATMESVLRVAQQARAASRTTAWLPSEQKNKALEMAAKFIQKSKDDLATANAKDIETATNRKLSAAAIDRLRLTDKTIKSIIDGLHEVAGQPDPVGEINQSWLRPNGMRVAKLRVPLGVIGIIYESRPNVTIDAAALCLKAGNATILRGGSEAFYSNQCLVKIFQKALAHCSIAEHAVQMINTTDRAAVGHLLKLNEYIDVVIPRGGKDLITRVVAESTIPVIKHYDGNCHVYVDREADLMMAEEITFNAKVQRPGVCNAAETLLVHTAIAPEFLPRIGKRLVKAGVKLRVCPESAEILKTKNIPFEPATQEDWATEYLDLVMAVKIVPGLVDAIDHINQWGSHHTDAIVTQNWQRAWAFLKEVDSSSVMVNASTRLSDGQQYGLGAEIGISTDKLHARGPMGAADLVCEKFLVLGDGQLRT